MTPEWLQSFFINMCLHVMAYQLKLWSDQGVNFIKWGTWIPLGWVHGHAYML